jgi:hypothetical protein
MDIANCIAIIDCFANNCWAVDDLRDVDETCCENRTARLASLVGIRRKLATIVALDGTVESMLWSLTKLWIGSSKSMFLISFE